MMHSNEQQKVTIRMRKSGKMTLMEYPFQFCSNRNSFYMQYRSLLAGLIGKKAIRLYGVWDQINHVWFEEAPMIIEFEHGELSVQTSSGCKTAILWNEIVHTEKPIWLDEPLDFDWQEDLVWAKYLDLRNDIVQTVEIIEEGSAVIGLVFTTNRDRFGIFDNGDTTIGLSGDALICHLDENCIGYRIVDIGGKHKS